MEINRQLYREKLERRKSLFSKLNEANERLDEANLKLLMEKGQSRSLLSIISKRPVLECPYVRNLNDSLVALRSFHPRENLVVHMSTPQPSNYGMEDYFTKMCQELENSTAREQIKLQSETFTFSPRSSANK